MTLDNWIQVLVTILSGVAAVIPVVYQLVKYVKRATQEKNWEALIKLTTSLMEEAETLFDKGTDKKDYVLTKLRASADLLNYEIDYQRVSDLIDQLCEMSKKVNSPTTES